MAGRLTHDPRQDGATLEHLWQWLLRWYRPEEVLEREYAMREWLATLDDEDFAHALESGWPWVAQEAGCLHVEGGIDPA